MLTLLWVKGNSSFLTTELGHQYFPAFRLELKHYVFLGLELLVFGLKHIALALLILRLSDLDYNCIMDSSGSAVCWLPIMGRVSLLNCVNQFHIINQSLSIPLRYCGTETSYSHSPLSKFSIHRSQRPRRWNGCQRKGTSSNSVSFITLMGMTLFFSSWINGLN